MGKRRMPKGGQIAMDTHKGCKEEENKYVDAVDDLDTAEDLNIVLKILNIPQEKSGDHLHRKQ